MSEPIRDADVALSREEVRALRILGRYAGAVEEFDLALDLALPTRPLLTSLAQRGLVERASTNLAFEGTDIPVLNGWRITPAGRRAVGAP